MEGLKRFSGRIGPGSPVRALSKGLRWWKIRAGVYMANDGPYDWRVEKGRWGWTARLIDHPGPMPIHPTMAKAKIDCENCARMLEA